MLIKKQKYYLGIKRIIKYCTLGGKMIRKMVGCSDSVASVFSLSEEGLLCFLLEASPVKSTLCVENAIMDRYLIWYHNKQNNLSS